MSWIKFCLSVTWLAAAGAGTWAMMRYENAPGPAGRPPTQWPPGSQIEHSIDQPTLVMVAHPRCPCTRASLGELAKLIARCPGKARTYVLFTKPSGVSEGWEQTDLWRSAAAIPGVSVIRDDDGVEARRFGAETSGQTLLYDAAGRLLFTGGITVSRGHYGDNAGRDALVSLLSTGNAECTTTAVFGCSMCDREPKGRQRIGRK